MSGIGYWVLGTMYFNFVLGIKYYVLNAIVSLYLIQNTQYLILN